MQASYAYDLNRFDESVSQPKVSHLKKVTPAPRSLHMPWGTAALFVLVVACLSAILLSYSQLTEANVQVGQLQKQLTHVQEEYKALSVGLEKMTNLAAVETYAREELGMTDLQRYQIEYITLPTEDHAEMAQEKAGVGQRLLALTRQFVDRIGSYLG